MTRPLTSLLRFILDSIQGSPFSSRISLVPYLRAVWNGKLSGTTTWRANHIGCIHLTHALLKVDPLTIEVLLWQDFTAGGQETELAQHEVTQNLGSKDSTNGDESSTDYLLSNLCQAVAAPFKTGIETLEIFGYSLNVVTNEAEDEG